ncbi:MAG: molybdopterin molybdotransferase MoeA [Bacteroidia bacterium]|nr:molybdopterin molybdotransferase MoeA [Bacteroidia bacterium]
MISVKEARQLIYGNAIEAIKKNMSLYDAGNYVLAEDVYSPINVPPFHQSAMDGYAFRFLDWKKNEALAIVDEIQAGAIGTDDYEVNTAVRIYTGAPIPKNYDTVVMQEKVRVDGKQLFIEDEQIRQGLNVRLSGSQTEQGSLALKKGTVISPGVAGYLAGLGFQKVPVFSPPKVCIINTGKELTPPGNELTPGKIYESNSYSLNAALLETGIKPSNILWCDDNQVQLTQLIQHQLSNCDVLILSGGVSVGDYDFVDRALANCGATCIFHKVKQKPGKPLYFGKRNNTLVFGLPGNPAAVLTCFYEYIQPLLNKLMGREEENRKNIVLPLAAPYSKKAGLTHFLKGKLSGTEVLPLNGQESYLMNSFVVADCIIELEEDKSNFEKGDLVEVHLINKHN